MSSSPESNRLRHLVEAGIALSSELSLDALLQNTVEAAASLTGARYAALGVINPERTGLERFVTTGIDADQRALIGDLPHGRGILGALITDGQPLRLRETADDPRSVGFPPNHPPMKGFLGVPVLIRGVAWGNLYLTEKEDGDDFSGEDEDLVRLLAAQVAVAIENARLYESATLWSQQLESLAEVGNALAGEIELPRLLALVADRVRELLDARLVIIALPALTGLRVEAAAGDDAESFLGMMLSPHSKTGRVLERRSSERIDSVIEDPEIEQDTARRLGATTGLYVPLVVRDRAIGVISAHDKRGHDPRFGDADLRIAETFAARAAVAADLSTRIQRDALRRVVAAQELERRRLARELHDETGQALTSILLGLKALEEAPAADDRRQAAAELRELVVETLQDVRRLAVELRPKALDDFGLVPALERLGETFSEQTGIQLQLEAQLGERVSAEIETALYRIVQEALTNVVKHASARNVSILLMRKHSSVSVVIEDDGLGFEPAEAREAGLGLLGMRERLDLIDGRFEIESRPGSGTTIVAEVPVS